MSRAETVMKRYITRYNGLTAQGTPRVTLIYSRKGLTVEVISCDPNQPDDPKLYWQKDLDAIRSAIQAVRFNRPTDPYADRSPGRITRIAKKKHLVELGRVKTPKSRSHHFGIEVEFISNMGRDELRDLLITHNLQSHVDLTTDASVHGDDQCDSCNGRGHLDDYDCSCECESSDGDCDGSCTDNCTCNRCSDCDGNGSGSEDKGWELRILCTKRSLLEIAPRLTAFFKSCSTSVNKTCGLHVHIDCRNRDVEHVYNNLIRCQRLLFSMVPVSRRKNSYCAWLTPRTFDNLPDGRYFAINGAAYSKHKTIEVRLHSGTVDMSKITRWVDILRHIVDAPLLKYAPTKWSQVDRVLGIPKPLQAYIAERILKFSQQREGAVFRGRDVFGLKSIQHVFNFETTQPELSEAA